MVTTALKKCNRCNEYKTAGSYGVNRATEDGVSITCKDCINERARQLRPDRTLDIICKGCGDVFHGMTNQDYCGKQCRERSKNDRRKIELVCDYCGDTFKGRPDDYDKRYCSLSCKNRYQSFLNDVRVCEYCENEYDGRIASKFCSGTCQYEASRERRDFRSRVASNARKITRNRLQECAICGYDKAVQVCHIKEVNQFPITNNLEVVNAQGNLILLCRNHHWELDRGMLEVDINDYRWIN